MLWSEGTKNASLIDGIPAGSLLRDSFVIEYFGQCQMIKNIFNKLENLFTIGNIW